MGLIKKYPKSIKVSLMLLVLILGTIFAVRRVDPKEEATEKFVRNNLFVLKKYQAISLEYTGVIDSIERKTLSFNGTLTGEKSLVNSGIIRRFKHNCRLNDSLYHINIYFNNKDSVIAMSAPSMVKY
jgi:hypothetical protein